MATVQDYKVSEVTVNPSPTISALIKALLFAENNDYVFARDAQ